MLDNRAAGEQSPKVRKVRTRTKEFIFSKR